MELAMESPRRIFDRLTARPVFYFVLSFWVAITLLWLCLQLLAGFNDGWEALLPSAAALNLSSSGLQAVVGNAVVAASAIVALVVAVAALRASEQGNRLSARSNELGDPDYALSHQAHAAYRKYGFLMGALIADYRLSRQAGDLAAYAGTKTTNEFGAISQPNRILEELRSLLFDTSFSVASLEAARVLDRSRNTVTEGREQHNLRRAFVGLNAALAAQIEGRNGASDKDAGLTWILAQASLLDRQVRAGLQAMVDLPATLDDVEGSRFRNYLKRWMGEIEPIETGEDLRIAVRARAFAAEEFLQSAGSLQECKGLLVKNLKELFVDLRDWRSTDATDPDRIGLHKAIRIAALCGDHSTILGLQAEAQAFARTHGWEPQVYVVNNVTSLPEPPRNAQDNRFFIFRVTRRTLPYLFGDRGFNGYTRGCVLVDGLRTADLCWVEDSLASQAMGHTHRLEQDTEGGREVSELSAFIGLLADRAYGGIDVPDGNGGVHRMKREREDLSRPPSTGDSDLEGPGLAGPRILWAGIDYRQLGVEPPTRIDDFTREMHSIFGWEQELAVSDEVRELTGL
ncbi:hypothetical protein [Pseudoxanthomonas mexicana]